MTSNFPAILDIYADLQSVLEKLLALDASTIESANLVPIVKAIGSIGAYQAAIDAQIKLRVLGNDEMVPGVSTKDAVKHRQWHDKEVAAQLAQEQFGDKAFKRELLSPAQLEKMGPEGKALVAVASFKPEADKVVVY